MFCPKCGAHNIEDAKFCRACGADISLVPQALARSLPHALGEAKAKKKKKKEKEREPPTLEKGLGEVFEGVAFLVIVVLGFFYLRGLFLLWIWFIVPALSNIGEGIGQIIRAGREPQALPPTQTPADELLITPAPQPFGELRAPDTSEIGEQPFSVTEGTTRHLDATGAAKR